MYDLNHYFGNDLQVSSTGDLSVVSGATVGLQRILRRLLTLQTNYLWNLSYGAGLPAAIGQPLTPARIQAVVKSQIYQEAAVARSPPPVVTVSRSPADPTVFTVNVVYVDSGDGQTVTLSLPVGT